MNRHLTLTKSRNTQTLSHTH